MFLAASASARKGARAASRMRRAHAAGSLVGGIYFGAAFFTLRRLRSARTLNASTAAAKAMAK